MDCLGKVIGDS